MNTIVKSKESISESDVLKSAVSSLLPYCAWLSRINGGRFLMKGRGSNRMFVSYRLYRPPSITDDTNIRLPDLLGQLKDGTLLAVEVKKIGGVVTDEQAAFLGVVRSVGGIAAICYDQEDVDSLISVIKNEDFELTCNKT